jgi:tetratricopeptide (TPR) repeat protein
LARLDTITDQMNEPRDQGLEANERGRTLLTAGDVSGAIAQLEASIIAYPHFKSLELLGEAWLQSGNALRAIVPLAAATTLNRQVRAPSLLAEALLASGDQLKAYEIAKLALDRDPKNRKALAVLEATEAAYRQWDSM